MAQVALPGGIPVRPDPYSALSSGIQQGMQLGLTFQQLKAQEQTRQAAVKQQERDNDFAMMKALYDTATDKDMPDTERWASRSARSEVLNKYLPKDKTPLPVSLDEDTKIKFKSEIESLDQKLIKIQSGVDSGKYTPTEALDLTYKAHQETISEVESKREANAK